MDLEMTYEQYKQYGQGKKFENPPDYSRYKKQQGWYEKVRSPKTGEFYQAEELIKRELVPEDWKPPRTKNGKPVKYPLKEVWEIYKIRAVDGFEWLKSRYMMTGLDSLGNEQNLAMIDPEMYNQVIPIYGQKPENPKDNPRFRDTKMIRVIDRVETRKKYTEPFTAEKAQKLYDGPLYEGKCNLAIVNESGDHPPVTVPSFEHFKSSPFEELWG